MDADNRVKRGILMLRQLIAIAGLACATGLAHAGQAGTVIFVAGKAQIVDRAASEGAPVQEGELLSTGKDGFIYVKTIDNGLFILRPNTQARIAAYRVDNKNPANTRIKLELLSGMARSRSGEAVKLARQNFRFNTPVAAIGVRGTDFTVFTDNNVSRVAVISGGIVMSGFADACRPEGHGPCEGSASRELMATQRGVLLQLRRGQQAPQLLSGGVTPEQVAPPVAENPLKAAAAPATAPPNEPNLDPKKNDSLITPPPAPAPVPQPPAPAPEPEPEEPEPPVVTPEPPVVPVPPAPVEPPPEVTPPTPEPPVVVVPERKLVWGRWRVLMDQAPKFDLVEQKAKSELVATNGNFALLREPGKEYVVPERGSIGFTLNDSDAYVYTDSATGREVSRGTLQNGSLNVNFDTRRFTTSLDLLSGSETFKLHAEGSVSGKGGLFGDLSYARNGFLNVQGFLSNEDGGAAAYVFDGRLDATRSVNGAAYFKKDAPTP